MTGWEKVAAATLVALIGLVTLNLAVWRRMRAAVTAGRASDRQVKDERQRSAEAPRS